MAVGEGGGELDKQILGDTWDSPYPEVVAIYLTEQAPALGGLTTSPWPSAGRCTLTAM